MRNLAQMRVWAAALVTGGLLLAAALATGDGEATTVASRNIDRTVECKLPALSYPDPAPVHVDVRGQPRELRPGSPVYVEVLSEKHDQMLGGFSTGRSPNPLGAGGFWISAECSPST